MIELKTKLRKWGNSFGIVVPQKSMEKEKIKEGAALKALLIEDKKVNLKKLFGSHKFKKSTEQMMREVDEELYNE